MSKPAVFPTTFQNADHFDERERASIDACVFHPGDKVVPRAKPGQANRDHEVLVVLQAARLQNGGPATFEIERTYVVGLEGAPAAYKVQYSLVGVDGLWHENLLEDARPLHHEYGVLRPDPDAAGTLFFVPLNDAQSPVLATGPAVKLAETVGRAAQRQLGITALSDLPRDAEWNGGLTGEIHWAEDPAHGPMLVAVPWSSAVNAEDLAAGARAIARTKAHPGQAFRDPLASSCKDAGEDDLPSP